MKADPELSYMWLQIAAGGGEDVGEDLQAVASHLNEQQLGETRQKAEAWRAQHQLEPASSDVASFVPTDALNTDR